MTSGRLLVRNTIWNLLAQVMPAMVAFAAVPVLLNALGKERFGVLTIAWAAVGYFSLFDLGLSRALTQAVSASLGVDDDDRLGAISISALAVMAIMGVVGGLIFAGITPWLVGSGLKVPAELQDETRLAFYLLSASLPFVVTTAGFRGLIEAHQHFGVATALRLPYATLMFLGPIAVLPWSHSVAAVVATLVAGRVLLCVAHAVVCYRSYPFLRGARPRERRMIIGLLRTGGWMTMSNVISPMMVNLDRFLIGGLISLAAVSYYATAFEVTIKLVIIPGAVLGVLFPAFAASHQTAPERTAELYDSSLRMMLFLMYPAVLLLAVFAPEILRLWVGADVATAAAGVMRILAIGVFINSLGQISFSALQAMGRPDLTAKLHMVELPLYVTAILLLATNFGLTGVALAWTGRVAFDTAVLGWLMRHRVIDGVQIMMRSFGYLALFIGAVVASSIPASLTVRALLSAAMFGVAIPLAWQLGLRPTERTFIGGLLRLPRRWNPDPT